MHLSVCVTLNAKPVYGRFKRQLKMHRPYTVVNLFSKKLVNLLTPGVIF